MRSYGRTLGQPATRLRTGGHYNSAGDLFSLFIQKDEML